MIKLDYIYFKSVLLELSRLSNHKSDNSPTSLEEKKEKARTRAKAVSNNARWAKKHRTTKQRTPGIRVVGYEFSDDQPEQNE